MPTFVSIENSPYRDELESEWKNMLGHQLQILPPFEQFWEELPRLFSWLEETRLPERLESVPIREEEDTTWTPPPTTWSWGIGIPLESIRFAATNHLCVELEYRKQGYDINHYLIEPYSLRRTKENNLIIRAIKVETEEPRTFRVDWIQSIKVTPKPFKPKYQIEFSPTGPITALPTPRKSNSDFLGMKSSRKSGGFSSGSKTDKTHFGPIYIFECSYCGKKFKRTKYHSRLNPHKDRNGGNCPGRTGYLVETRYD
ncbi:MAG: WYL domain-containing protein [bacterium]